MSPHPHLVYIVGEPGIGKSTLMAELTAPLGQRIPNQAPGMLARDLIVDPTSGRVVAVELGKRRPAFSGTDALGQAVVVEAEKWLRSGRAAAEAPLVLAEGARLANERFLRAAVESGWCTTVVYLFGPRLAAQRRHARAVALSTREQNASWVQGRGTAARNLANRAEEWGCAVVQVDVERVEADDRPYGDAVVQLVRRAFSVERAPA